MCSRGWLLTVSVFSVLLIVGGTAWYALAQNEAPSNVIADEEAPVIANPVVAALPYRSETEYDPDPFEPERMRSSQTEIKELVLVRADGTIEHKRAW